MQLIDNELSEPYSIFTYRWACQQQPLQLFQMSELCQMSSAALSNVRALSDELCQTKSVR